MGTGFVGLAALLWPSLRTGFGHNAALLLAIAALLGGASRADESWTDSANLFRRPLWAPRAAADDRDLPACEDSASACLSA